MKIKELYVYPIKSLGGVLLKEANLTDTGIQFDRYWMLVKEDGTFITQREFPKLALFRLKLGKKSLTVTFKSDCIEIPIMQNSFETLSCNIWKENVLVYKESDDINHWFSSVLGVKVYLVRKNDKSQRTLKNDNQSFVNFPDADQYLIIGEESINNLNQKLENQVNIDRFRPNIVFESKEAHIEDSWKSIQIGNSTFKITESCSRCKLITVNQQTGEFDENMEPLKTLATYRLQNRKIMFGQYLKLVDTKDNLMKIGDKINIISSQE